MPGITKDDGDGDDEVAYARFEQASAVEQSYFAAAAETIGTELFIRPYVPVLILIPPLLPPKPPPIHPPAPATSAYRTPRAWPKPSATSKPCLRTTRGFCSGSAISRANRCRWLTCSICPTGRWGELFEQFPAVDRWFEGLRGREAWARAAGVAGTVR